MDNSSINSNNNNYFHKPKVYDISQIEIEMVVVDKRLYKYGLPNFKIGDAGVDLRAVCDSNVTIKPGCLHMFGTGIKIHIANPNYFMAIYPRSGLGTKGGIIANSTGIIDSNYMGEIKVHLYNRSNADLVIEPFTRVVQGVLQRVYNPQFKIVDEFTDYSSTRGECGFGSSGMI